MISSNDFLHAVLGMIDSLRTTNNKKIEFINQVEKKSSTLLSADDLNNPCISKKDPMPLKEYIENVLYLEAEFESENHDSSLLEQYFNEFKNTILDQLNDIHNSLAMLISLLDKRRPLSFVNDFSNGALSNNNKFKSALESVISYLAQDVDLRSNPIKNVKNIFDECASYYLIMQQKLKSEIAEIQFDIPKSFEPAEKIFINPGYSIPLTNGIDIHPSKDMYVASTNRGGDMVFNTFSNSIEINRIKMNNCSGDKKIDNYLWSPSGEKLLVATYSPSNIFIYNEIGQLLKSAIKTHATAFGYGATWVSETITAIGYENGDLKFFDTSLNELQEISCVQCDEQPICGMSSLDGSHILVGSKGGYLEKVNWIEKKTIWKRQCHNIGKLITVIRVSADKTKAFTGSEDFFVKCVLVEDGRQVWQFKMSCEVYGLALCVGDAALVALSRNTLSILNIFSGQKMQSYSCDAENCCSLRLNIRTDEILVGDFKGTIRKYMLTY